MVDYAIFSGHFAVSITASRGLHLIQKVAAEDPARDLPLLKTPEGTTLTSHDLEAGNFG